MRRILFLLSFVILVANGRAAPALSIEQAIKVANDTLKERGLTGQTWITGVTLESTAMAGKTQIWVVKWNAPIVIDTAKRETGLEIQMDGTYARYVDKSSITPGTAGIPADRAALSNHRTRSDRPSILDLKH
jgi:hypothetical protein